MGRVGLRSKGKDKECAVSDGPDDLSDFMRVDLALGGPPPLNPAISTNDAKFITKSSQQGLEVPAPEGQHINMASNGLHAARQVRESC